ncbi:hypothetical protein C0993_004568, partial [Termitomyces sp. T159_Od127]
MEDLGEDSETEELEDEQVWDNKELTEKLIEISYALGNDPNDEDWLPRELRKKKRKTT